MARSTILLKRDLEEFLKKYPEGAAPLRFDDEFRFDVETICDSLTLLKISYTGFNSELSVIQILDLVTKIIKLFHETDILVPINNINFVVYMVLCQRIVCFKSVIVSEILDDGFVIPNFNCMFDCKIEQYICDTYKSKFEGFKSNCSEEELQTINESFTYFLLTYVKLLSNLNHELKVPLERNIELLSEVGDLKILLEHIHSVSHLISKTMKIHIFKKITNFCIKKNFNLQNCKFIKTTFEDIRLETYIMSYFTLQHVCKYLELQKMHQTSQILSQFKIEDIISSSKSVSPNSEFKKLYEESFKLITFKTYKKIKVVPSHKIKKCLKILQLLLDSSSGNLKLQNCPFAVIILSILSEFVMATDFDKSIIISLIDLVIGYLEVCKLPSDFMSVSYAFKIYRKLKSDSDLEVKSINLCKCLSSNLGLYKQKQHIQDDFEKVINCEEDWIDKSVIISHFLSDVDDVCMTEDKTLNSFYCTLNEIVLLSSQYIETNVPLIFPYSLSLHFSIINKNEDCLFNNLAILDDYLRIIFEENQTVRLDDKKYFLTTILRHYEDISQCLPNEFLIKCWRCVLNPQNMDISISKALLNLCSSKVLAKLIEILKTETMKIIEGHEPTMNEEYYSHIHNLWSSLLNMHFINQKKKVRKDNVNHFCFILNRTFVFNSGKVKTEKGLILLLKLVCSLIKISWINRTTLINCSLRIITFVERSSHISEVQLLTETAELLIVLYKCPNNSIKPFLGLYVITFTNFFKRCWSFINELIIIHMKRVQIHLFIPFHKLEKCSSLFKQNRSDFDIICRFIIEDLIELVALENRLPEGFMRHFYNIIFNLMDVCSSDEMKQLMLNIQGPALLILRNAYKEYRSNARFRGRL